MELRELLTAKKIATEIGKLPGWKHVGKEIRTTVKCRDFIEAMGFVTSVALLAEKANHHPDIDIRWNKVSLVLSTHSAGGLTAKDFALASKIAALGKGDPSNG